MKDLREMNLTSNSEVRNRKNKSMTMEIRAGGYLWLRIDRKDGRMELSEGCGRVLYLDGGGHVFQNSSGYTYKIRAFRCK